MEKKAFFCTIRTFLLSFFKDFKVPKIRFKEFTDVYVSKKLSELVEVVSGGTPDTSNKFFWNGDINWFTPTEVGLKKYVKKSNRKITSIGLEKSSARLIPPNSILMTSRASIGLASINLEKCSTNQGFQSLIISKKINLNYLFYLIHTVKFQNTLIMKSTKSTFQEISNKEVKNTIITIPNSIDEQIKVGLVLDYIDKKINLINSRIKVLKKYKEGLIMTLIKNGNNEGYLSEHVVVEEKTRLPSSFGKPCGSYPFFINNDEKIEKYCDSYIFDGTYLILNTGGCASIKFYEGKFSAMSDCLVLKPKRNPTGLYFFLKAEEKKINQLGFQGTGLRHLDQNWLFRQMVCLPPISEDVLECLNDRIDQKISTMEKKVKLCEKIKDFLLVNMFI